MPLADRSEKDASLRSSQIGDGSTRPLWFISRRRDDGAFAIHEFPS